MSERIVVSARVEPALSERVWLSGNAAGDTNRSATVCRLVELGLDAEARGERTLAGGPGTHRRNGGAAQRQAAATVRTGTARHAALGFFVDAAAAGATADEVAEALEDRWPLNTVARRVTDLLQAGLIIPVRFHRSEPVERAEAAFALAGVWGNRGLQRGERRLPDGTIGRRTRAKATATVYAVTMTGLNAYNGKATP